MPRNADLIKRLLIKLIGYYKGSTTEKEEEQKGPVGSGQIMADILKSESGTQEKKYRHD